jgi:putative ABC transport system ATP-binding protein
VSADGFSVVRAVKEYRRGAEVVHALRDVDLSVEPGELVALVGPSGSGKSTLLFALAGWETLDSGVVTVLGAPPGEQSWGDVGVVPQALGLIEDLTLRENAALPVRLAPGGGGVDDAMRNAADAELERLIDELHLGSVAQRRPAATSLGEQQRAAVARALVLRPPAVLADEPSTHQDHVRAGLVFGLLRSAAERGAAVVVATHDPAGYDYADRVVEMRDGAVVSVLA